MPDGSTRWIGARGKAEHGPDQRPLLLRGVSLDITERRVAENEAARLRNDLAHLARVNTLGELATSLAHEINQPLGSILTNAQAAQRLITQPTPDLKEVQAILADIVDEDQRG